MRLGAWGVVLAGAGGSDMCGVHMRRWPWSGEFRYDEDVSGSVVVTMKHLRVAEVVTLFAEKEQVSLDILDVRGPLSLQHTCAASASRSCRSRGHLSQLGVFVAPTDVDVGVGIPWLPEPANASTGAGACSDRSVADMPAARARDDRVVLGADATGASGIFEPVVMRRGTPWSCVVVVSHLDRFPRPGTHCMPSCLRYMINRSCCRRFRHASTAASAPAVTSR